ncbi:hypothetical protein [Bradyrhizobium sp. CSS354]|uniref:hypothetical protein n=1 Tax=Bradyrhizobium sp. CSS354 TaxID=2699172 RepID=UPI0023B1867B|nr:hypothetical protein [Bradyrhizobium sp. CSS354]MDE5460322.1 hypothetical protein [Bradyrhizobium sp. CSS354]
MAGSFSVTVTGTRAADVFIAALQDPTKKHGKADRRAAKSAGKNYRFVEQSWARQSNA